MNTRNKKYKDPYSSEWRVSDWTKWYGDFLAAIGYLPANLHKVCDLCGGEMPGGTCACKQEKTEAMCEHMIRLVDYCRENKVYFGGCGDCGSPWLDCAICNKVVDDASEVFDEHRGGTR